MLQFHFMAITLKEALAILESNAWCSLRFITANLAKGSGGEVRELARCRITQRKPSPSASATTAPRNKKSKAANHHQHFTRNVETQANQIIKVHPPLITHINNTAVL
jgi:hypothetical protein